MVRPAAASIDRARSSASRDHVMLSSRVSQ